MTGEPTHTASKERMTPEVMFSTEHVPQLSITGSKVKWPLCFAFSYVQPVSQHYKRRTVGEVPLVTKENMDNSHLQMQGSHWATTNRHLELSAKRNGTQRRTKGTCLG